MIVYFWHVRIRLINLHLHSLGKCDKSKHLFWSWCVSNPLSPAGLWHWTHQNWVHMHWICLISLSKVNAHLLTCNRQCSWWSSAFIACSLWQWWWLPLWPRLFQSMSEWHLLPLFVMVNTSTAWPTWTVTGDTFTLIDELHNCSQSRKDLRRGFSEKSFNTPFSCLVISHR